MNSSHTFTRAHRLTRKVITPLFVATIYALGIGTAAAVGSLTGVALLIGLGLPVVLHFAWILRNYVQDVAVSDEGLEAQTLTGHKVSMRWPEIASIEVIPYSQRGRRLRVTAVPDRRRIVLTEPLSDFAKLEEALREQAKRATWTRMDDLLASLFYAE
jgi:hypothetical protein